MFNSLSKLSVCVFFFISVLSIHKSEVSESDFYPKSELSDGLDHGSHSVGYSYHRVADDSRQKKDSVSGLSISKEIELGVWYPAIRSKKSSMLYGEYLKSYENHQLDSASLRQIFIDQKTFLGELNKTKLANKLAFRTNAFSNAKPKNGNYPVVLYLSKTEAPVFENNVLFEYLASHGFVVLAVPPRPPYIKEESWALSNYKDVQKSLDFIASQYKSADLNQIVTCGYEIGGVTAASLAIGNNSVKGHISLNGAIGSKFGWGFSKEVPNNDLSQIKVPVLHIGTSDYESKFVDFELMDMLTNTKRMFKYYPGVMPISVSSYYTENWTLSLDKINPKYQVNRELTIETYQDISKTFLEFLNTYVKGTVSAKVFEDKVSQYNDQSRLTLAND